MGESHEENLFDESVAKRIDRVVDKCGAVVEGNDFDASRKARLQLFDFRLDSVNKFSWVYARSCDDNSTDRFAATFYKRRNAKGISAAARLVEALDLSRHA